MKGYFSLRCDVYTREIYFGKLHEDIGLIGYLNDVGREDSENSVAARLIAHDVIEHSVEHRTNTYVTYEAEIRAIGAAYHVRTGQIFNQYSDVLSQLEYLGREIKPVPYTIGKFLLENFYIETEMMRYLIENGVSPGNSRNACYQFAWGNYQKAEQLSKESPYCAFRFIRENVFDAIQALNLEEAYYTGISIYFDTIKHIFRWTFKRA